MTKFVKETDDRKRTYIIEGEEKKGNVFSIKRFICQIQNQETDEETQQVADMLLKSLNRSNLK